MDAQILPIVDKSDRLNNFLNEMFSKPVFLKNSFQWVLRQVQQSWIHRLQKLRGRRKCFPFLLIVINSTNKVINKMQFKIFMSTKKSAGQITVGNVGTYLLNLSMKPDTNASRWLKFNPYRANVLITVMMVHLLVLKTYSPSFTIDIASPVSLLDSKPKNG